MLLPTVVLFCAWRLFSKGRQPGRWKTALDWAAAAGLLLCCWPAAAWLFVGTLERRYPVEQFPAGDAEAIVVLGGSFTPTNRSQPEPEPGITTYLRAAHAAWLFHHWKQRPIVVSGGTGGSGDPPVAELMRRQLVAAGVPEPMIQVESGSANTYENAVETGKILLPRGIRRIALVTETFHLLRAELCFRKQGFTVVPAGCCYRTLDRTTAREMFVPNVWAVRVNEDALREWIGLISYKLRGRI